MNDSTCSHCDEAREILQTWLNQQGHDRCWYYPELFEKLVKLFGVTQTLPSRLPPRAEFEEGCRRYQNEEFETKD